MTYLDDATPLEARTNDNFEVAITLDYNIIGRTCKFKIKTQNSEELDYSDRISTVDEFTLNILIKADDVKLLVNKIFGDEPGAVIDGFGQLQTMYSVYFDYGEGSKDFLFGGILAIKEGF